MALDPSLPVVLPQVERDKHSAVYLLEAKNLPEIIGRHEDKASAGRSYRTIVGRRSGDTAAVAFLVAKISARRQVRSAASEWHGKRQSRAN
jgi:hypothetical protein